MLALLEQRLSREVEKKAEKKPAKKRRASAGRKHKHQPEMRV